MSSLLLLLAALGVAQAAEVRRYALIAGANNGGPERVTLRYAATDAQHVAAVLGELGGLRPADELLLTNPRRADIEAALRQLNQKIAADKAASRRTEVLFYYSGHSDENGLLLGPDRYPYKELRAAIDGLGADVKIAILDSCASGAMVRQKGGTHVPAFLIDESSEVKGHAFLTSSSADEASQEADRIGASYFTHALVTGLRGGADRDLDGQVTLTEAYQFAYDETLRRTESTASGAQHPAYDMRLVGTGDLVMTDLRQTSAALRFAPEVAGRLFVRDADGQLVAELSKSPGRELLLGLEPGTYTVTREEGKSLQTATLVVAAGGVGQLTAGSFGALARSPTVARGEAEGLPLPVEPLSLMILPDFTGPDGMGLAQETQTLALGLVAAGAEELDGWALSVGANLYGRRAEGGLFSAGANIVQGELEGVAGSAGVNIIGGITQGVVLSGGANLHAGAVQGALASGGANVAAQGAQGILLSGGANVVGGRLEGLMVSGGVNLVGAGFEGGQLGVVNIAGGAAEGGQIAVVNVAEHLEGLQLGVVNIADDLDGVPIGLISYSGTGILAAEVWGSETVPLHLGFKMGARHVYNTAWAGGDPRADGKIVARNLGYGIGARYTARRFDWDTDVVGILTLPDRCNEVCLTSEAGLRSSLSFAATPWLAPYAGGMTVLALPFDASGQTARPINGPDDLKLRSSVMAGLRFSRPPRPRTPTSEPASTL